MGINQIMKHPIVTPLINIGRNAKQLFARENNYKVVS